MAGVALMLTALQAASAPVHALPPEDALARYFLCVARMASVRAGNDPADRTAEVSAIACEGLLSPAVDQVMTAVSGSRREARRRIGALLEVHARREAVARNAISKSYEDEKR